MEIKITKKQLLQEMNNEMTSYKKYLVYAKIYNSNKTWSKNLKFVQTIFKEDIFDYAEKEYLTPKEQNEITNVFLYENLNYYNTDKDTSNLEDFKLALKDITNFCNQTIIDYNTSLKGYAF